MRRRWYVPGAGVGIAAVVAVHTLLAGQPPVAGLPCRAAVGTSSFDLDAEQARNATTIAGVGARLGLPDHAVTIALATALQESRLHNLDYGDRDSVGLFQQRPSQGWGTRSQVLSPAYASAAFYRRLTQLSHWQGMSVTVAAQAVQRSAAPDAYAAWEDPARLLARTLTGEVPAAFRCRPAVPQGPVATAALRTAMVTDLGRVDLDSAEAAARQWTTAGWLVSRADRYRIRVIDAAGMRWTAATGSWSPQAATGVGVHVTG